MVIADASEDDSVDIPVNLVGKRFWLVFVHVFEGKK